MPPIRRAAATGLLALWLSPLPAEAGGPTAPTEAALPAGESHGQAPLEAWRERQRRSPGAAGDAGADRTE